MPFVSEYLVIRMVDLAVAIKLTCVAVKSVWRRLTAALQEAGGRVTRV